MCGVHFCAGLEAADGDDHVPQPDPGGEGAWSTPQYGIGAIIEVVETWDDTAAVQADEGGAQQLVWQLGRQLGTGILPGQRKSRNIQGF